MELKSYLLGKKAGGGGTTPTGTISITENGTYDVTDKASAEVNVSGGGTPSSLNDIQQELRSFISNIPNNYETYTSDSVTLYTPAQGYNTYFIFKRNSSQYRIGWLQNNSGIEYDGYNEFMNGTIVLQFNNYDINNLILLPAGAAGGTKYYSTSLYSSINDCITALQSNSTTYNSTTQPIQGIIDSGDYIIPYTNSFVIDENNIIVPSQRISKNETIQVIS